ncbi:MAG: tetratricopeptide repeat protein [Bacteroidaceae bacterium]|nr:tetratricopeptide repeat protein [Bacteroidaceae bacterium]
MAKKSTKPAAQQQNGVEETVNRWEQFFVNNKKTIFTVMAAIIIVIAGGMILNTSVLLPRENRAAEALFPGENLFIQGDYQTALEGDGIGYEGFEAIAKQYGCTKAGRLANLYAGLSYAQLDSAELAVKFLSKFKGSDMMVSPAALGTLAGCYADLGNNAKAAATFEKAAKKADNGLLSPYLYFQAALTYEAMGNTDKALKLYRMIQLKYPESQEGIEAEKYIARIAK